MKMEKEMKYVAPEVETLEVMMELGFAGSVPGTGGDANVPPVEDGDWE